MSNKHALQLGYKPFKKNDANRTVFLKDNNSGFFELSIGLGMDLSAALAQKWFFEVANKYPIVAKKVNEALQDESHKYHYVAVSLEADENGKEFKKGLAVSLSSLISYLYWLECIKFEIIILSDCKDKEAGAMYMVEFLDA